MSPAAAPDRAARMQIRMGDLWIDQLTFPAALDAIEQLVQAGCGGAVFTPNVDHIVNARSNAKLREAYTRTSLSLADGQPVVWAARLLGTPLPAKISGSDLVPKLLERAIAKGLRVYLLGGEEGVAAKAAARLTAQGVIVVGAEGPRVGIEAAQDEAAIIARVKDARPDLILVGLGSPKQERFIDRACPALAPAILLGVGASLDFLAGTAKRSPAWMSRVGLEWLYRLVREPRRLWRRYLINDPAFAIIVWQMLWMNRAERVRSR